MCIVVQKYGGTSVSTAESREIIANNAIELMEKGKKPVIVVSAMGRNGAPYATDTLINMYKGVDDNGNNANLDLLMSCGETISSTIMANTIVSKGYKAIAITGFQAGIITDDNHGSANVMEVKPDLILHLLKQGYIVIVTGFQGITRDGFITTLGRGGSDTTAAILGEALDAEMIEIYTDVDGVLTTDPRIDPDAKVIGSISYEDMYQMAVGGAKVVDHKAINVAKRSNKKLMIKNTFSHCEGTVITSNDEADSDETNTSLLTAVTNKNDIAQFNISVAFDDARNEVLLDMMEKSGINIDLINFFDDRKIFTVNDSDILKTRDILDKIGLSYTFISGCTKVTAVGHRIHGVPGVMKRIVLALSRENIEILQTSDSYTTISCLVRMENLNKAVNILTEEFGLKK